MATAVTLPFSYSGVKTINSDGFTTDIMTNCFFNRTIMTTYSKENKLHNKFSYGMPSNQVNIHDSFDLDQLNDKLFEVLFDVDEMIFSNETYSGYIRPVLSLADNKQYLDLLWIVSVFIKHVNLY